MPSERWRRGPRPCEVCSTIYEFPNRPAPETSGHASSHDQTNFFHALADLFAANRNGVVTTREFYDTFIRYGASSTYLRSFIRP